MMEEQSRDFWKAVYAADEVVQTLDSLLSREPSSRIGLEGMTVEMIMVPDALKQMKPDEGLVTVGIENGAVCITVQSYGTPSLPQTYEISFSAGINPIRRPDNAFPYSLPEGVRFIKGPDSPLDKVRNEISAKLDFSKIGSRHLFGHVALTGRKDVTQGSGTATYKLSPRAFLQLKAGIDEIVSRHNPHYQMLGGAYS